MLTVTVVLAGLGCSAPANAQTDSPNITIVRRTSGTRCTTGEVVARGQRIAYALELPDAANLPEISAIPPGAYKATTREDGQLRWRIELRGVPGRDHVQLHVGNETSQTRGCILVGSHIDVGACRTSGSRAALEAIEAELRIQTIIADGSAPISVRIEAP